MDGADALTPQERLASFVQARASRPIVPSMGGLETLHIGDA